MGSGSLYEPMQFPRGNAGLLFNLFDKRHLQGIVYLLCDPNHNRFLRVDLVHFIRSNFCSSELCSISETSHSAMPLAVIGQSASTDPFRTQTYQS